MSFSDELKKLAACPQALAWVGKRTREQALAECERADWLMWYAAMTYPRTVYIELACRCAERALKYVPPGEDRPRLAIAAARAVAQNNTRQTRASARAASSAAEAATEAASRAASWAANEGACAAAWAANDAAHAAASAALTAAWATTSRAAAAWATAGWATTAWDAECYAGSENSKMCEMIRDYLRMVGAKT